MTFFEILTAAINDLSMHGFDSVERVDGWVARLRAAATTAAGSERAAETMLNDGLAAIYQRLVERGGISRFNPGVQRFTLEQVKPKLRTELDRRTMASAQLIKRNRAEAIEKTLHRFQGWATSIPTGGAAEVDRMALKKDFGKPLRQLDYASRRLLTDQGHKFTANLSDILARSTNALACEWRSNWRRPGYQFRVEHKDRDLKVYMLKGNWALAKGFVRVGSAGWYDDITKAGEEIACSCTVRWIYNLRQLPDDMLTDAGRDELARVRRQIAQGKLAAPGVTA